MKSAFRIKLKKVRKGRPRESESYTELKLSNLCLNTEPEVKLKSSCIDLHDTYLQSDWTIKPCAKC